jgi:hypothetical protein
MHELHLSLPENKALIGEYPVFYIPILRKISILDEGRKEDVAKELLRSHLGKDNKKPRSTNI